MKINIIIPSTVLGGGIRVIFTYANLLQEAGHDVVIYVPKLFKWKDIKNGRINLKTSLANTFKRRTKVDWFECNFLIKSVIAIEDKYIRDADIVIATAWYTAKNVAELSNSKGKKCYFIQGYEVSEDESDKKKVEATYKLGMHNITIAKWLDNIVYDVTKQHSKIIQNGIADNEFLQKRKIINNPKTVIMLGNMAAHKGTKQGIKILEKMQKKYNIRVIIYASMESKEIPESFDFYLKPSRDKLMELYSISDICLFPSVKEGWGLIVTEAMAHKCAVVGNNTGCVNEIGVDGINMLISKDNDYNDLEKKLEKVILDTDLMIKIQNAGYETVLNMKNSLQFRKLEDYFKLLVCNNLNDSKKL